MDEHLYIQHGEPSTVGYYVKIRGRLFDPRRVEWSGEEVAVRGIEVPGESYTSRRGKEFVAQEGRVTLWQPTPLLEMNVFTDADPVLRFLIRHHDQLREVGVEEVVVMLGFYRNGQRNAELDREQVKNLCRAGASIGFSFYEE